MHNGAQDTEIYIVQSETSMSFFIIENVQVSYKYCEGIKTLQFTVKSIWDL